MGSRTLAYALIASIIVPTSALAEARGYFWGLDASVGTASGSSSTTDGGAPFAGGGVTSHVKFGSTTGIGAQAGYRIDPDLAVFASYQHIHGHVAWRAHFPLVGASSEFTGKATTQALMVNVSHRWPLSDATSIKARLGLGVAANSLSGMVETDSASGSFLSNPANHTKTSPTALIGASVQHEVTQKTLLGFDISVAHSGSFQTGNTRTGNLGVTSITPYKIDKVWRVNLGASVNMAF